MSKKIDEKNIFINTSSQKLLEHILTKQSSEFHDIDIYSKFNDICRASINNALNTMSKIGLIIRTSKGKQFYNRVNLDLPEIIEFKKLINILNVKKIIKPCIKQCVKVVLFGSCASGENTVSSDIDLFIISNNAKIIRNKLAQIENLQLIIKKTTELIEFRQNNKVLYEQINKGIVIIDNETTI